LNPIDILQNREKCIFVWRGFKKDGQVATLVQIQFTTKKSPKFGLDGHPGNVPKGSLKGSFG
jgi:hypothetical protein